MRRYIGAKFALVGLTVAAPLAASAGDIPTYSNGGFRTPAQSVGRDGRVKQAAPSPATATAGPGVTQAVGSATMVMSEAEARAMTPPGKIVACAHSRHGVCPECQKVLDMPGTVTMLHSSAPAPAGAVAATAAAPASEPGRAVVSAGPSHSPVQHAGGALALTAPDEGPAPIGVVQANFQNGAGPQPVGMVPGMGMQRGGPAPGMMGAPGRAMAGGVDPMAGAGSAPYQKPRSELRPNILGHLFGWSYIGKDFREQRAYARDQARSRSRAAAAMAAMNPGNGAAGATELPAGMVYGSGGR